MDALEREQLLDEAAARIHAVTMRAAQEVDRIRAEVHAATGEEWIPPWLRGGTVADRVWFDLMMVRGQCAAFGEAIQLLRPHMEDAPSRRLGAVLVSRGVSRLSHGGRVRGPGTATSDSIPALLSDGEFVLRAAAVRRFGVPFLESLNAMRVSSLAHGSAPVVGSMRAGTRGVPVASQVINVTVNVANNGAIGSQMELENWFTRALDGVARTGRLPAGLRAA